MKTIALVLTSLAVSTAPSWGQAISVPTFGGAHDVNTQFVGYDDGATFGQGGGWTVTGPASSSISVAYADAWATPDNNATADMDGNMHFVGVTDVGSVGQIQTILSVPGHGLEALVFTSLDGR